jgi:ribosomal protein L40E
VLLATPVSILLLSLGLLSEDIGKQVLEAKIKEIMPNHIPRDGKTCEKCQTMNTINAKFCDQCGNKFCFL